MHFLSLSQTHRQELRVVSWSPAQIQGQDPLTGPEGMVGQVVDSLHLDAAVRPALSSAFRIPSLFFYYDFYDFNFLFWLCCFFVGAALVMLRGRCRLSCSARFPHCGGFSGCGSWVLGSVSTDSVVATHRFSCHPSSCLTWSVMERPGCQARLSQ